MNFLLKQAAVFTLACALVSPLFAKTPLSALSQMPDTLIVPGERIGFIKIGADTDAVDHKLGEPDGSDAAMGKASEWWSLGAKHGDLGRPFRRPGEIALFCRRDDAGVHYLVTQVSVTSPNFATAEGIAPGNTLDAIRAKYPGIQSKLAGAVTLWPSFGVVEFFQDTRLGIAFAIRKRDNVCIQIMVTPAGEDYLRPGYPSAAQDCVVDDINGTVGDIKLGMNAAKLIALLGQPDEKRDVAASGVLWRWRIPGQRGMEVPALCIYMRKLPDDSLVADQIRVSSPAFALTDKIFPGCALKDAQEATPHITKLDSYDEEHLDVYGDLRAGLLFDIRTGDNVCTAITIFPPPLDVHRGMGTHWLDLPPPTDRDD